MYDSLCLKGDIKSLEKAEEEYFKGCEADTLKDIGNGMLSLLFVTMPIHKNYDLLCLL